jgi:hypothetical protein
MAGFNKKMMTLFRNYIAVNKMGVSTNRTIFIFGADLHFFR